MSNSNWWIMYRFLYIFSWYCYTRFCFDWIFSV
jgi:hypothetical protein